MKQTSVVDCKFYSESEYSTVIESEDENFYNHGLDVLFQICWILRQIDNVGTNHPISKNTIEILERYADGNDVSRFELIDKKIILGNFKLLMEPREIFKKRIKGNLIISDNGFQYVQDLDGFGILGHNVNYYAPVSIFLLLNKFLEVREKEIKNYLTLQQQLAGLCCREIIRGKAVGKKQLQGAYQIYLTLKDGDIRHLDNY